MKRKRLAHIFTKGLLKDNPILRLLLGICPALAVTTSAINGIGMGLATAGVLLGSNVLISLLRNLIPDRVRIPAFITISAGFTSVMTLLIQAFSPGLESALGIFLPLIATNCIILARAEMFATKNRLLPSVLDALGMGLGFTIALFFMGAIREFLGAGTLFGYTITTDIISPSIIMLLPPGGFFVFGILIAVANKLDKRPVSERPSGCNACLSRDMCKRAREEGGIE
jgi:electron transport complex protein RnfE